MGHFEHYRKGIDSYVTNADHQWHKKQVKATSKAKSEETQTFEECVANLTVLRVRVGFLLLLAAYWQVIAVTLLCLIITHRG